MDEFGLDYTILYPSQGLRLPHIRDAELRTVACRAFNMFQADTYRDYAKSMTPVAAVPMHTPDEAIAELEFVVRELGLKVVMIPGFVRRPIPWVEREHPELAHLAERIDPFGIDSDYDYDPVWAKFVELGVAATSHQATTGWGSRRSPSLYMYNHAGHFAEAGEIFAKALFLGGVTRRFPKLNFAFLEGGVAWGAQLYAGMVGRWYKRNGKALRHLDPATADIDEMRRLTMQYAHGVTKGQEKRVLNAVFDFQDTRPEELDDWSACQIKRPEDLRELMTRNFYFGCEADDPLNATAFDTKANPFGATLKPVLGSDMGHWDVPDMTRVLEEAYELVERELLNPENFRDFVFTNPVKLHAGMNPDFFKGTRVEAAANKLLRS
jgi:predicted TIM-barrel fold metal-dependent hydrolase